MSSNRDILIAHLEKLPLLANRYRDIKCVNYDPASGEKRGCFSLVFRAFDVIDDRVVALKFFDIDYSVLQNAYRIKAFEREPEILKVLLGQERCLQLAADLDTFEFEIKMPSGALVAKLPCKYFAVDWIDQEIDQFFHNQHAFGVEEKLRLFNEIVLSVEALHKLDVFHRDLKPDNMRAYMKALKRIVVAIDLGTAARVASIGLVDDYKHPVGASAYAPPEAFCGFAGDRTRGKAADVFALGCLLFELFHAELFAVEVRRNRNYGLVLAALAIDLLAARPEERLAVWRRSASVLERALIPVTLDGIGTTAPHGIRGILNNVLARLTRFNFLERTADLEHVRAQIWTAIHLVRTEAQLQKRAEIRRVYRKNREEKLRRREERLAEYLRQANKQCSIASSPLQIRNSR
jgi:serine/threonine protein kinase